MSQVNVERFLGRLITDAEFRANAGSSLHRTCHSEGFMFSTAEMKLLSGLDLSAFDLIAKTIDDSIRRK